MGNQKRKTTQNRDAALARERSSGHNTAGQAPGRTRSLCRQRPGPFLPPATSSPSPSFSPLPRRKMPALRARSIVAQQTAPLDRDVTFTCALPLASAVFLLTARHRRRVLAFSLMSFYCFFFKQYKTLRLLCPGSPATYQGRFNWRSRRDVLTAMCSTDQNIPRCHQKFFFDVYVYFKRGLHR